MDSRTTGSSTSLSTEGTEMSEIPLTPPTSPGLLSSKAKIPQKPRKQGPVFRITGYPTDRAMVFGVLGCSGDQGQPQKAVSALMSRNNIDIVLGTGDNEYPNGNCAADDPKFETNFYQVYPSRTPHLMSLGNHDAALERWTKAKSWFASYTSMVSNSLVTKPETGELRERHQVNHTYLPHRTDPVPDPQAPNNKLRLLAKAKENIHQIHDISLNDIPKRFLPDHYYSMIIGKTQFFFINTNTLVKDFLTTQENASDYETQLEWLRAEYKKAEEADRTIFFVQHNPIFTNSKRSEPRHFDADLYLTADEIKSANRFLGFPEDSYNYCGMLEAIYQKFSLLPDMLLVAHDHILSYFNNIENEQGRLPICQITSGGGGEPKLLPRKSFENDESVGCYVRSHGEWNLTFKPDAPLEGIRMKVVTIDGLELDFTDQSPLPIRENSNNLFIENMRSEILTVCNEFILYLNTPKQRGQGLFSMVDTPKKGEPRWAYTEHDTDTMDRIRNYLNQRKLTNFDDVVRRLHELISQLSYKAAEYSLYKMINNRLQNNAVLGFKTIEDHFNDLSQEDVFVRRLSPTS